MKKINQAVVLFVLTSFIAPDFCAIAHAATTADATATASREQQRFEEEQRRKSTATRVEEEKVAPAIEVGQGGPVADETTAAVAAAEDQSGVAAPEALAQPATFLSESSEAFTVVIKSIRVPDDAPISRYEMEALVQAFEGKEVKLSELIYLTENISQLYVSAELVSKLNSIKEGFNEDEEKTHPTIFILDKINVPSDAAISQEEVEALVKPYEGKELTLSELRSFAKSVDKIYMSSENINAIAEGNYTPMFAGSGAPGAARTGSARKARGPRPTGASAQVMPTEDVPFLIEKIEVTGNTIIPDADIRAIVSPYEGKTLKLEEAKQIALSISQLYRTKGYITCRAYVPPQKLTDKVLKIQILEGKLGKIKVQGNKYFANANIKKYLQAAKGKVLQYDTLKKDLEKSNLHPDREVKAVIIPGKAVGTSDLILDVKDNFPLHIGGEINNYGTKLTGRERYNISVRHTNLTGHDDIFATRFQFGEEVFAVGTQYAFNAGPWDTQFGATFNYTDVNVGGEFSVLDIGGKAYSESVFVNQLFYDTDFIDLTATGAFEAKHINNTILNTSSSVDDIRNIHAGLNVDETDRYGRSFMVNDFVTGVTWLGGSDKHDPRISRSDSGADYFKYVGSVNRIHPVYDQTYLFFKGDWQVSTDKLLSAEQFDLGGPFSVRGYPQSDYLGDSGYTGSAEIRVPLFFIDRNTKAPFFKDTPLWNSIHMVGFVDGGHAALRSPAPGEFSSRNYLGVGGGLRIDLPKNLTGRFEWASPVGADDPIDGSSGQFYFTISGDIV